MTIIPLHHLYFGHCVNSLVIVLNLGIFFLRERIPRSKTITSDFTQCPQMVGSYYCLIPTPCGRFWEGYHRGSVKCQMHLPSVIRSMTEGVKTLFGSSKWAYLLGFHTPPVLDIS